MRVTKVYGPCGPWQGTMCGGPIFDDGVETYVKRCKECQQNRPHEQETLL